MNPNHHDIGLVFLSTPIKLSAYPVLSSAKVAENTKAINVGRVLNGTEVICSAAAVVPSRVTKLRKDTEPSQRGTCGFQRDNLLQGWNTALKS